MTAQSKTVIKSYFETGDRPTQSQFVDLIDSYQNASDLLTNIVSAATTGTGLVRVVNASAISFQAAGSAGLNVLTANVDSSARAALGLGALAILSTVTAAVIASAAVDSGRMTPTGVSAGTYAAPTIIVDAAGRITSATGGGSSGIVKISTSAISSFNSGTTVIPNDDTIPQITEGNEFLTISHQPLSSTNRLQIRFEGYLSSSLQDSITTALFQDAVSNALAAMKTASPFAGAPSTAVLEYDFPAGTTSNITFRIRCGSTSGTTYFNSDGNTGVRKLGGVAASRITVTEYTP